MSSQTCLKYWKRCGLRIYIQKPIKIMEVSVFTQRESLDRERGLDLWYRIYNIFLLNKLVKTQMLIYLGDKSWDLYRTKHCASSQISFNVFLFFSWSSPHPHWVMPPLLDLRSCLLPKRPVKGQITQTRCGEVLVSNEVNIDQWEPRDKKEVCR